MAQENVGGCMNCGHRDFLEGGLCIFCRMRKERKEMHEAEFSQAKEQGEAVLKNEIMCPYCGDVLSDDWEEIIEQEEFQCPQCDKESKLEVEWDFYAKTIKKEKVENNENSQ